MLRQCCCTTELEEKQERTNQTIYMLKFGIYVYTNFLNLLSEVVCDASMEYHYFITVFYIKNFAIVIIEKYS